MSKRFSVSVSPCKRKLHVHPGGVNLVWCLTPYAGPGVKSTRFLVMGDRPRGVAPNVLALGFRVGPGLAEGLQLNGYSNVGISTCEAGSDSYTGGTPYVL